MTDPTRESLAAALPAMMKAALPGAFLQADDLALGCEAALRAFDEFIELEKALPSPDPEPPPERNLSRRHGRYGRFDHEPDTADVAYECESGIDPCVLHSKYGGVTPEVRAAQPAPDPEAIRLLRNLLAAREAVAFYNSGTEMEPVESLDTEDFHLLDEAFEQAATFLQARESGGEP